ncbi:MAG: redox-sensing transcriptional repressor Rex [Actinomycetota bacterium]|nr:redox-sensing transcriptional repressor Rex [Actinomycetota bacterium]
MPERYARRIPEPTVIRLPLYQRVLSVLAQDRVATVSSAELAEACGVNAAKVRKDLSHFGTYGTPGTGYDVEYLLGQIKRELGSDRQRPVVICGMGNLGHALAGSPGFRTGGFEVVGLFDVAPRRIGEMVAGCPISHISELAGVCASEQVSIGVVATPPNAAQDVSDRLVAAGVTGILNFAPAVVSVPFSVQLRQVDFSAELQVLAFYQAHPETAVARRNGERQSSDPGSRHGV